MTELTRWVLRHKLAVLAGWLVVFLAGLATVGLATESLTGVSSYPGREGYETNQRILRTYATGGPGNPLISVITLPSGMTVDSAGVRAGLGAAGERLGAAGLRAVSYPDTGNRAFVAGGGRTVFGVLFVPYCAHGARRCADTALAKAKATMLPALPRGSTFAITGLDQLSVSAAGAEDDESALVETAIAAGAALVVLLFVFGSLFAVLPLIIAAVSILAGFLAVLGITQFVAVASIVEYVIAFIGLGVALDYALLVTTRWREESRRGFGPEEAVVRTMATAGRAVVASGGTVALGLILLVVVPNPGIRSVAIGGALVPLFAVLVTITLLPVLLATVGRRLDWPRLRSEREPGRLWSRWAGVVTRHPWWALVGALMVTVPLGLAALTLQVGDAPSSALPGAGPARMALTSLAQQGVPAGTLTPIEVLVPAGVGPDAVAARLSTVEGVYAAAAPTGAEWRRGGTALVTVLPEYETSTAEGRAVLDLVRDAAHSFAGVTVGGSGAAAVDELSALYDGFPALVGCVALISFLVLTRTFRSPVLALQAVFLNLLSVAGAYGALVLVWQNGFGSQLIWGIPALGAVDGMAPLITFAFLFGLSMDFEVFLLSRIREEYARTGSTATAIGTGLGRIGRLVTSAALIMFLSFASLAALPAIPAKIMATGLGVAVLLDATILRAVLMPALVTLAGKWAWWMPTWLARIMRVPDSA